MSEVLHARRIWDYCNFRTPLVRSDAIVVLCSHDLRLSTHAAHLYREGWAPRVVFSGGLSGFTSRLYSKSEAETFAEAAGLPAEAVWLETQSGNTQENLEFSMALMRERGLDPSSLILVQKPNMLRRVYATATKLFPSLSFTMSSHEIALEEAPHQHVTMEMFLHELAGDIQRLRVYADRGFLSPQEIDPSAWESFERLRDLGYTRNLVK